MPKVLTDMNDDDEGESKSENVKVNFCTLRSIAPCAVRVIITSEMP